MIEYIGESFADNVYDWCFIVISNLDILKVRKLITKLYWLNGFEVKKKAFVEEVKLQFLCRIGYPSADSEPLGYNISTFLQSQKTQSLLNVKRLNSNERQSELITPNINFTITYSHATTYWIRILLGENYSIDDVKTDIMGSVAKCYNVFIQITKQVHEIYFDGKLKIEVLEYFNNCPFIDDILFVSDCKTMFSFYEKKSIPIEVFVSNSIKFLYCYTTKDIVFNPSYKVSANLISIIILSLLYTYKYNLKYSGSTNKVKTPLGTITGEDGNRQLADYITKKNQEIEVVLYDTNNDRDIRVIGLPSTIGFASPHEMEFNITLRNIASQYLIDE